MINTHSFHPLTLHHIYQRILASLSSMPFLKTTKQSAIQQDTCEIPNPSNGLEPYGCNISGDNSLQDKISKEKSLIMALMYRDNCPYCQAFIPDFKTLAKEYTPKGITFTAIKFNDDPSVRVIEKEETSKLYGFQLNTFPSLLIFKNGKKELILQGDEKQRELNLLRAELDKCLTSK